ncbi:serine hydrolase family protein [Patescibacteria group bacterium]|nr:serine hydrolase family protein [Patescibacteria group bacterium]
MKSVFIIHGSTDSKDAHWFPWLKKKLEERGLQVFLPQFPVGEGEQTLENWLKTIEPMKEHLQDSIMVGHSLGVPFILDVLNEWDVQIQAAFLVGGFGEQHEAEGEPNMDDFAARNFDWRKIKNNCSHFYIIHSDNDPYVPLEKAQRLAKNLDTDVMLVSGAGHFQSQGGYSTFDLLLEKINEELNYGRK